MIQIPTLADLRDRLGHARGLADQALAEEALVDLMADTINIAIRSGHLAAAYDALMAVGFSRREVFAWREESVRQAAWKLRRAVREADARCTAALEREFGLTSDGPFGDEPPPPAPRSPGLAEMVERVSRTGAGAIAVFGILPAALLLILP